MRLSDLDYKPQVGKGLRDIIDLKISIFLHPSTYYEHQKIILLDIFHVINYHKVNPHFNPDDKQ